MYKRGVRTSHMDEGRHWRFAARFLQRPGSADVLDTLGWETLDADDREINRY